MAGVRHCFCYMKSYNMFFKKRNMSSDKNYKDKKYDAENLGEGAETMDVDPTEDVQPEAAEVTAD